MNTILIALFIGIIAGIIDVVPMLLQKLNTRDCWSAFLHYLVLGLIIPFVGWEIAPWLKGFIIAELSAIPVMIVVYPKDQTAMIPMSIFAGILGSGIGIAGSAFIG